LDKVWGIGVGREKAEKMVGGRGKWGMNLLGKALMVVREELLLESSSSSSSSTATTGV
jgi:predicted NAD-dependent protein-ADP-ribosyltransferase YbiA (DUF1768 family)